MTVHGPGHIDLFDNAANAPGPSAYWLTSMVQTKDTVNGRLQDLYTFTDKAMFEDKKSDFWLRGNVLKLWLEPQEDAKGADGKPTTTPAPPAAGSISGSAPGGQQKPSRIQAIGEVTSHSTDFDIDESSLLNAFFADAKPAPAPKPTSVVLAPAPQPRNPMTPAPATTGRGTAAYPSRWGTG